MKVSNLCTPAFVYFIMSFVYLIINSFKKINVVSIIVSVIGIMAWSWFLNYLCKMGYTTVSWLILIVPLVVLFRHA
jgi:hypothetical protein